MTIAVTGATGFIGRHLVAELARRSISPTLVCLPSEDLAPELSQHKVVRCNLKVVEPSAYERLGRPEVLIHLAWGGLPNYRSLHHFEDELPAHYRFLKSMVESGVGNILVAGTCFEYGMQSGPLSETSVTRPDNPYGFAKDSLRRQLEFLQQAKSFNLTWARLFYLFGNGQHENSLLPQLKKAVDRGDRTFPMSGGEQLRDYLPVAEVAEYLVSMALTLRNNGPVNICSGKPVSVRALVERWILQNKWAIDLQLGALPYPAHESMAFWGVRDKLERCLRGG